MACYLSGRDYIEMVLDESGQNVFGHKRHEINVYLLYYTIGHSDLYHVT
jgi:hypothetical protein